MWIRFLPLLRCPHCGGVIELAAFKHSSVVISDAHIAQAKALGVFNDRFNQSVEAGLLLCNPCATMFPIVGGLPVLLPYTTRLHSHFEKEFLSTLGSKYSKYQFPDREPMSGERFVMESFSKEWLEYDYDGVIWEMNYEDHENRFLTEIGLSPNSEANATFLEIGCGLGITTYLANKNFGIDAVGLDLSLAVLKANQHFRANPFLHFVQASVFAIPFKRESFGLIYSRGVLHHTYSTHDAFKAIVPHCQRSGKFYLWVYGLGSINETIFRRAVYCAELALRPLLSRYPTSWPARLLLGTLSLGYMVFNFFRRRFNPQIQPLTFSRGMHAARDRFTPQYAHRHAVEEVVAWFEEAGFEKNDVLDWRIMPPADHDDYRRNVGVRGTRK